MDEIRRNHIIRIRLKNGEFVEGEVLDYSPDRVKVLVFPYSIENALSLKELDEFDVFVHTHLGIKEMPSCLISELDSINCIIIENNQSKQIEQKRAFVRVLSDLKFKIIKNDDEFSCVCVNISAGGVAFITNKNAFNVGDMVKIHYPSEYFEKDINLNAVILKENSNWYVAKYVAPNPRDEDRIVKYVFKTIVKY